jgi:hypothetical protein
MISNCPKKVDDGPVCLSHARMVSACLGMRLCISWASVSYSHVQHPVKLLISRRLRKSDERAAVRRRAWDDKSARVVGTSQAPYWLLCLRVGITTRESLSVGMKVEQPELRIHLILRRVRQVTSSKIYPLPRDCHLSSHSRSAPVQESSGDSASPGRRSGPGLASTAAE